MPRIYTVKSTRRNPDALIDKLKRKMGQVWITPGKGLRVETVPAVRAMDVKVGDKLLLEREIVEIRPDGELRAIIMKQGAVRVIR